MTDIDEEKETPELAVVIMAGGAGTRFWPLSTEDRPKQFLRLFGDRSLLQQSYDRVRALVPPERVLVLTSEAFVPLCREQLPELPTSNLIGEPQRKDTAAAVALAALICQARFGDPTMAILTADQLIEPMRDFQRALCSAARGADEAGALYTFGVPPTHAATGYGYLELGKELSVDDGIPHHELARFKEKPDEATANAYLESGRFLWNSGMFVWRASAILDEFQRQLPAHLIHLRDAVAQDGEREFAARLAEGFDRLDRISIDFGIMENARAVRAVRGSFAWSDVGSFESLWEYLPRDEEGNAARGRIIQMDARGNIVVCEDEEESVALIGIDNHIVVRAKNKTLLAPRNRGQDIKKLVESLDEALR